jgi:hypothetical protein
MRRRKKKKKVRRRSISQRRKKFLFDLSSSFFHHPHLLITFSLFIPSFLNLLPSLHLFLLPSSDFKSLSSTSQLLPLASCFPCIFVRTFFCLFFVSSMMIDGRMKKEEDEKREKKREKKRKKIREREKRKKEGEKKYEVENCYFF